MKTFDEKAAALLEAIKTHPVGLREDGAPRLLFEKGFLARPVWEGDGDDGQFLILGKSPGEMEDRQLNLVDAIGHYFYLRPADGLTMYQPGQTTTSCGAAYDAEQAWRAVFVVFGGDAQAIEYVYYNLFANRTDLTLESADTHGPKVWQDETRTTHFPRAVAVVAFDFTLKIERRAPVADPNCYPSICDKC